MSLPNTYQEVEYIESTGTQYIDTNVPLTQLYGYEIKFLSTGSQSNSLDGIFGTNNIGRDTKLWFSVRNYSEGRNSLAFQGASTTAINYVPLSEYYKVHTIKVLNNICYYDGEQLGIFENTQIPTSSATVAIFAMKELQGHINYYSKTRLWNLKIYNSQNEVIRNFIPCYRKSDNEIGLYDSVNDVFYTNGGTGTFLKGRDVTTVIEKLNYLNETKGLIKQAISSKGQTITNEDPFRSYVGKINAITPINNWSEIGYQNNEPQTIINNGYNHALEIQQDWVNVANLTEKFSEDRELMYFPLVDTSNATNMTKFMYNCYRLETLSPINISNVTNMSYALYNCRALKTVPNIDFSNVTNLSYAFYYNASLEHFDADSIDTSKVTNWQHTFEGCSKLTTAEVQKFDFSGVSGNTENMFASCIGLTSISISSMPNITNAYQNFISCSNLEIVNLPSMPKLKTAFCTFQNSGVVTITAFDTSNASDLRQFLYRATQITNLPVFDFSNVTTFGDLFFYGSGNLLTNQSLNNLMESLAGATKYTGTKTLKYINLPKAKRDICPTLEKWQMFTDAGWSTGD